MKRVISRENVREGLAVLHAQAETEREEVQKAVTVLKTLHSEADPAVRYGQDQFVEELAFKASVTWEQALEAFRQMEDRNLVTVDASTGEVSFV